MPFTISVHTPHIEKAIVDTVASGGDSDTNAAICGALCGAVHGTADLSERWLQTLRNCKPSINDKRVKRPRPEIFWPSDAETLAVDILNAGKNSKYRDNSSR